LDCLHSLVSDEAVEVGIVRHHADLSFEIIHYPAGAVRLPRPEWHARVYGCSRAPATQCRHIKAAV